MDGTYPVRNTILVLGILLASTTFQGCLTHTLNQNETPSASYIATYTAHGPVYLPGFWPALWDQYIGSPGSETTLEIALSPGEPQADAHGEPVSTVNMTYHVGGDWIRHWVHPTTGTIVSTEQAALDGYTRWHWTTSGLPALAGHFDALTDGNPPEALTITCCPESPAYGEAANGTLRLELEDAKGDTDWLDAARADAGNWTAPGPRSDVQRAPWPGHHPPETQGSDAPFPLSEAIDELRECDSSAASFMDEHPDWRLVSASYFSDSASLIGVTDFTTVYTWKLSLEAEEGPTRDWGIGKYVERVAGQSFVSEYECGRGDEPSLDYWQEEKPGPLLGYEEGWSLATSLMPTFDGAGKGLLHLPRNGEPLVMAERAKPSGRTTDRVFMDLETGLLAAYAGDVAPKELIHANRATGLSTEEGAESRGSVEP